MATIRAGKRRAAFSFSVDMLTGSPLKKMLIFGLPLFAVNVLNMLTSALTVTIYNKFVGGDAFYVPFPRLQRRFLYRQRRGPG